jgi:aminoglycoside phosphotransferase (APT) family kinase protein
LASLHRSPIRIGSPETDWGSLKVFRLTSRVIKAAAARPNDLDLMLDLLDAVEDRVMHLRDDRPTVQTHGRYHHDHVYVGPASVVTIDLDWCRPSDPAKDVAEFLHNLRLEAFKKRFDADRTEAATRAFLDEYLERVPETAETLGCYWGASVFHNLLGTLND